MPPIWSLCFSGVWHLASAPCYKQRDYLFQLPLFMRWLMIGQNRNFDIFLKVIVSGKPPATSPRCSTTVPLREGERLRNEYPLQVEIRLSESCYRQLPRECQLSPAGADVERGKKGVVVWPSSKAGIPQFPPATSPRPPPRGGDASELISCSTGTSATGKAAIDSCSCGLSYPPLAPTWNGEKRGWLFGQAVKPGLSRCR